MAIASGSAPVPARPASAAGVRLLAALLLGLAAAPLAAQGSKDEEELRQAAAQDPYTLGDAEAMAKAGIVAYGPFRWTAEHRTEDIDRVLGAQRVLWLETAHFRIGCSLAGVALPQETEPKKALLEEVRALRELLPRVPDKPRRLDPWLRLHLYAQRVERLYAAFQQLVGASEQGDASGQYLGLGDKYLLLLFQKKSDLARYLERFCGTKSELPLRYYHQQSRQLSFVVAVDAFEDLLDEPALHSHVIYSLVHNLAAGYRGYMFTLPPWLAEGLAHWYSRQVATDFINVTVRADEAVNDRDKHEWARKVRLRAQHEGAFLTCEQLLGLQDYEALGYQAHIQSWSRVDFLMSLGGQRVGALLTRLKSLPPPLGGPMPHATLLQAQLDALAELWQFDPAGFDAAWRQWVLRAYAKR